VENDLSVIADRLRTEALDTRRPPDEKDIQDDISNQNEDGSWSDVDYDDRSKTHWNPRTHLRRLVNFARVFRTPGGPHEGSSEVRDAFLAGLNYWVERDPQSDNWFRQSIGTPASLGDAVLLMGDEIPPALFEATGQLVRRSGFTRTGANLIWESTNLLTWACVTRDHDLLNEVIDHIGGEIRITTEEGIQPDDSFHQHGPQNYILGYGRSYARNVTSIAVLLTGTSFAFPEEKIRILSRLILDGQQWFIYGRQVDYHAMGREAFRGGPGRHNWNAGILNTATDNMATADPARSGEHKALANRIKGEVAPGASGPLGNKHFWRSDTMVHRAGNWYTSVRFHSTRTYAVEVRVNRENLQGYHLSDGVTFLMQRGDEYHDLQPVWDYRKLPGLTFLDLDTPIPYGRELPGHGNADFVGGASDGISGVAVMDFTKEGVSAKKAYFFTDQGVVCLGAGITSDQPERVLTTLNQCRLASGIVVAREGKSSDLTNSEIDESDLQAILHDGVAYIGLEGTSLVLHTGVQSGSWSLVEERSSDGQLTEEVFTSYIDHGSKPSAASYAYQIVPGASDVDLLNNDNSVRVLANTSELQAVHTASESLTQAIFHAPAVLDLPEGSHIRTDASGAIQYRAVDDKRLLTVADPTQKLRQLTVTLDGRVTGLGASYDSGENVTRVTVLLPEGPYAGQSVLIPLVQTGG
jgi:chondroitin AC lyase